MKFTEQKISKTDLYTAKKLYRQYKKYMRLNSINDCLRHIRNTGGTKMIIKIIPAGIYDANCYILEDEESKQCAVIDPGGAPEILINEIKKIDGIVKFILLTHGHADHTGAVVQLRNEYKCPVFINQKDFEYINKGVDVYGRPEENGDSFLKDGELLSFGAINVKVIETPGHTPGGVSFLIGGAVFTGDTLFYGSIGRTDFAGGDYNELITSIKTKLVPLPDDTVVYPGHGPKSSIGFEKKRNPYL